MRARAVSTSPTTATSPLYFSTSILSSTQGGLFDSWQWDLYYYITMLCFTTAMLYSYTTESVRCRRDRQLPRHHSGIDMVQIQQRQKRPILASKGAYRRHRQLPRHHNGIDLVQIQWREKRPTPASKEAYKRQNTCAIPAAWCRAEAET